jgi:hypothetical protein
MLTNRRTRHVHPHDNIRHITKKPNRRFILIFNNQYITKITYGTSFANLYPINMTYKYGYDPLSNQHMGDMRKDD